MTGILDGSSTYPRGPPGRAARLYAFPLTLNEAWRSRAMQSIRRLIVMGAVLAVSIGGVAAGVQECTPTQFQTKEETYYDGPPVGQFPEELVAVPALGDRETQQAPDSLVDADDSLVDISESREPSWLLEERVLQAAKLLVSLPHEVRERCVAATQVGVSIRIPREYPGIVRERLHVEQHVWVCVEDVGQPRRARSFSAQDEDRRWFHAS